MNKFNKKYEKLLQEYRYHSDYAKLGTENRATLEVENLPAGYVWELLNKDNFQAVTKQIGAPPSTDDGQEIFVLKKGSEYKVAFIVNPKDGTPVLLFHKYGTKGLEKHAEALDITFDDIGAGDWREYIQK